MPCRVHKPRILPIGHRVQRQVIRRQLHLEGPRPLRRSPCRQPETCPRGLTPESCRLWRSQPDSRVHAADLPKQVPMTESLPLREPADPALGRRAQEVQGSSFKVGECRVSRRLRALPFGTAPCSRGTAGRDFRSVLTELPATARAASFPGWPTGAGTAVRLASWLWRGSRLPPRIAPTVGFPALGEELPTTSPTQRNPLLSFRLSGLLLLRLEARKLSGLLLFQEPPRNTRALFRCRRLSRASKGQRL